MVGEEVVTLGRQHRDRLTPQGGRGNLHESEHRSIKVIYENNNTVICSQDLRLTR